MNSNFITKSTISETFLERVKTSGDQVAFRYKTDTRWKDVSFRSFFNECRVVSLGLINLGVKPGDRVAIISNTRFEWQLSDMAILGASGITVPVYPSNTQEDVVYILNDSGAKIVILESAAQLEKILDARAKNPTILPHLEKIVTIEQQALAITLKDPKSSQDVLTLDALKEIGRREEARDPGRFEGNLRAALPTDTLTICYTSGTTGIPKGAILTHDCMVSVMEDAIRIFGKNIEAPGQVTISFLPFSHILGKVESLMLYTFGWTQAFAESVDKLVINMGEVRPTLFFSVPRVFEKAYGRIATMVGESSVPKQKLFQWAMRAGRDYYTAIWSGRIPSFKAQTEYLAAKKLVFAKLRARFGGRLKFSACGGAPLPREVAEFFTIVGIQLLEGYGLTETCAPVTFNTPDFNKLGTVGRPLPEVMVKIAEDGEILVKSRKVFKGYYNKPKETEEAFEDGWFKTGDIGFIDSQGYLTITDRKKDLIITSAGKNVAPQKIEARAKTQKLISHFVVIGDRRNYLSALVALDKEQIIRYASEQQILFSQYSELVRNSKIMSRIQKAIDEINEGLASYETIKKFVIVPNEFTIETGELTPSLKVKRRFIAERYKAELDSLYA